MAEQMMRRQVVPRETASLPLTARTHTTRIRLPELPRGCRDLPASSPSAVSDFGVYSGDLNSGFHVSVTGSLSTESSPQHPKPRLLGVR